jgi:hypothetical protein
MSKLRRPVTIAPPVAIASSSSRALARDTRSGGDPGTWISVSPAKYQLKEPVHLVVRSRDESVDSMGRELYWPGRFSRDWTWC